MIRYTLKIFFIFLLIITACGKKKAPDPENVVVARIGNQEITVRDFRINYEFGFSHLKTGDNRKLSYLQKMIDEEILSLRGYELGLDKNERVQKLDKALQDELVIEQVFMDNVNSKVEITDQEIKDAINKSKVSWKLRYWFEPNIEFAQSVYAHMREHGYTATVDKILSSNPEVKLKPKDFETPYLTWLDISDEILEAVKNLQIGEISEPVKMDRGYYIFQLVDIKREPVTEYEYANRAGTYRKILKARKEQALAKKFISSFMTPKNVVTKGDAFADLSENLYEWYKNKEKNNNLCDAIEEAGEEQPYMQKLHQQLDRVLVTFKGGQWTVKDFLDVFNPRTVSVTSDDDLRTFRSKLNQQIALSVRDHFLLEQGYKDKVQLRPAVKEELKRWTDKWVYRELRTQLTSDIQISDEEARAYFEKYKDRFKIRSDDNPTYENNKKLAKLYVTHQKELALLNSQIADLKKRFGLEINYAVLDTITTIESEKSRWMSLQVFKGSSKRMAYPVVDPSWGF